MFVDPAKLALVTDDRGPKALLEACGEVVETMGPGDALCAGNFSERLNPLLVADALERAVRVEVFAVAADGDWEGVPTRNELELLDRPGGSTVS